MEGIRERVHNSYSSSGTTPHQPPPQLCDDPEKSSLNEVDNDNAYRHQRPPPGQFSDIEISTISRAVINQQLDVGSSKNILEKPAPNSFCSTRYLVAYLTSLGFLVGFMGRATLSVGITAMVNSTSSQEIYEIHNQSSTHHVCQERRHTNGSDKIQDGPFHWSTWTQELILASFYYGFPWLQLPAGYLADMNGRAAVWLLGIGYGVSAVVTLVTPFLAHVGVTCMIVTYTISGLIQGWAYPVFFAIISRWAPPGERSRLVAIGSSGIPLGLVLGQPIAGLWASSDMAGGWPSAFYFSGTIGVIWFIFWMILVYPSPSSHPRISSQERDYIEKSLLLGSKRPSVYPWKSILTSLPVLAACIGDLCVIWILYLFTTNLPIYLKGVLRFDILETGFLAAVPFIFYWVVWTLGGRFADFLIARTRLSKTAVRKLVTTLACVPSSVLLVSTGYVGCNTTLALLTLTIGLSTSGLAMAGASMTQLDFAPRYAGIITAIINVIAGTSGFLAPLLVGKVVENQADQRGWRIVFWITAGIVMFGLVFFLIFGTSEIQPWATEPEEGDKTGEEEKKSPSNKSEDFRSEST